MTQRPEFTLVQLRYFQAAAETGSMTGASQALRVAQSAVSSAVAHLERSLRLQLFIRHHARGLTLTADGQWFLREARNLLAQAAEVAAVAGDIGGSPSGRQEAHRSAPP